MSKNRVSKPLLFVLAALVLLTLLKVVGLPLWQWRGNQIDKLSRQKNNLSRMIILSRQTQSLEQENKKQKKVLDDLAEYCFSAQQGTEKLQLEIQQIVESKAAQAGVEMSSVKWLRSIAGDAALVKVALEVCCQGTTQAITSLIASLESHKPLLAIESLSLAAPRRAKQLKATLVLVGLGIKKL